jgi:putative ATP-dependent endonuclease of OLD family
VNCLIGPGDAGKTTLLEAIGLATSPAPASAASEHDYFRRRTEHGFEIELVIGELSDELLSAWRIPACWGWRGPDEEMVDAAVGGAEAVLRMVVRGTPDLEVEHRLLAPNDEELNFSADKRRLLGLCRVGEMRGSSREFRMARGSLLERTLGREDVRGAAARAVRAASSNLQIPEEVTERLAAVGEEFKKQGISSDQVALEVLSPPGQSLLGLLGLALGEPGEAIALAYSGQGAQRLASYVLATELAEVPPLLVMDELETGLEPYRQRLLVVRLRALLKEGGQAFITTHAPAVLAELQVDELQRVDLPSPHLGPKGDADAPRQSAALTQLPAALAAIKEEDPEALLARIPVVCEGATEVELHRVLLEALAVAEGKSLAALGVRLVDGGGQPRLFDTIRALRAANFTPGVFVDNDPEHAGKRERLEGDPGVVCGGFGAGHCTEAALAAELPEHLLDELLEVGDESYSRLGESRRRQLAHHMHEEGDLAPSQLAATHGWAAVREALGQCAHDSKWFKTRANAPALARWLADGHLPAGMAVDLGAFWKAVRLRVATPEGEVDEAEQPRPTG